MAACESVLHPLLFDELAPGFVSRPEFVAGIAQDVEGSSMFFGDKNVVRVVGRDRENRNIAPRQWLDERQKHSGHRERKRPFELETYPAMRRTYIRRQIFSGADDG